MEPSPACLGLIKRFESCRLVAYLDPVGIPTIGWGHTSPSVRVGDTCTQAQADAYLDRDVRDATDIVTHTVVTPLTQSQFDALVSFVFNVGPGEPDHKDGFVWLRARDTTGAPRASTMLTLINEGALTRAADEFPKWAKAAGKSLPGLTTRRRAERTLFLGGNGIDHDSTA